MSNSLGDEAGGIYAKKVVRVPDDQRWITGKYLTQQRPGPMAITDFRMRQQERAIGDSLAGLWGFPERSGDKLHDGTHQITEIERAIHRLEYFKKSDHDHSLVIRRSPGKSNLPLPE